MGTGLHAIMVSVDYTDLLRLTLPYNRHHFNSVHVVTTMADADNVYNMAKDWDAKVWTTDLFYANGARFNKWAALEWALDRTGLRECGWLCLMDADVLWPKKIGLMPAVGGESYATRPEFSRYLRAGYLYTPRRRMCEAIPLAVPDEVYWGAYPLHRNEVEFAGYSQIFHTSDPVLGPPPWHQIDWTHAGGADSFFQMKWPSERKIRPTWEVLHLGPAGANWCGRATARADGSVPDEAHQRQGVLSAMFRQRRNAWPGAGMDRFTHERLGNVPQLNEDGASGHEDKKHGGTGG